MKKHTDKPGWRDERKIPGNLGGGELVLFDGRLNPDLGGSARWVLHHFPSGRQASYPSLSDSIDMLRSVRKKGFAGQWKVWGLTVTEDTDGGVSAAEVVENAEVVESGPSQEERGDAALLSELEVRFNSEKLADKIEELMEATKFVQGAEVPDNRIQLQTLTLVLNHRLGLPIQRQELVSRTLTTEDDLKERMRTSPHYRRAMRSVLDKLDAEQSDSEDG